MGLPFCSASSASDAIDMHWPFPLHSSGRPGQAMNSQALPLKPSAQKHLPVSESQLPMSLHSAISWAALDEDGGENQLLPLGQLIWAQSGPYLPSWHSQRYSGGPEHEPKPRHSGVPGQAEVTPSARCPQSPRVPTFPLPSLVVQPPSHSHSPVVSEQVPRLLHTSASLVPATTF